MSRFFGRTPSPPQDRGPRGEAAAAPPAPSLGDEPLLLGRAADDPAEELSYHELAKFIKYMQKRMDFIAQVTTSPPSWCFSTSWRELLENFVGQHCLTSNIILSHQEVLAHAGGGRAGRGQFAPAFDFWLGSERVQLKRREGEDAPDVDFPAVDIPHAQIGAHAFYTILENIIRNTAKYGDREELRKTNGELRFNIKLEMSWPDDPQEWARDFYRVTVEDTLRTRLYRPAAAAAPSHAAGAAQPAPVQRITDTLNGYLSRHIIDPETMTLAPGGWGMKEIKICAAYLRMVDQDRIDETFSLFKDGQGQQPPVVAARLAHTAGTGPDATGNLQFVFYLLRSKTALLVEAQNEKEKLEERPEFLHRGMDFMTPAELRRQVEDDDGLRHGFLVLYKKYVQEHWKDWSWLSDHINFLPHRIMVIGEEKGTFANYPELRPRVVFIRHAEYSRHLQDGPDSLRDFLWRQWTQRNWSSHVLCVRWKPEKVNADRTVPETWDNEGGEEDLGRWLVYDHRDESDATRLYRDSAYHQAFSSGSVTAEMLASENRDRIKEAAALTVVVIDERIWMEKGVKVGGVEASKYRRDENKTLAELWRKRRVYIQDTDALLRDFPTFIERLRGELRPAGAPPWAGHPSQMCDFLVIHQTILDELRSKDQEAFTQHWAELKQLARWVVIDTGRGQPEQARLEKLRWVEYSNLAECLVGYAGDKFRLAHLLSRLRASSAKIRG